MYGGWSYGHIGYGGSTLGTDIAITTDDLAVDGIASALFLGTPTLITAIVVSGIESALIFGTPELLHTRGTAHYIYGNIGVALDSDAPIPLYVYGNVGIGGISLPPLFVPRKAWPWISPQRAETLFSSTPIGSYLGRLISVAGTYLATIERTNYSSLEAYSNSFEDYDPLDTGTGEFFWPRISHKDTELRWQLRKVMPVDVEPQESEAIIDKLATLLELDSRLRRRLQRDVSQWSRSGVYRIDDLRISHLSYLSHGTARLPELFKDFPDLLPGLKTWREQQTRDERLNWRVIVEWASNKQTVGPPPRANALADSHRLYVYGNVASAVIAGIVSTTVFGTPTVQSA